MIQLSLVQPEGHRAVIRDVRQDFDQSVRVAQLVVIQITDFDEAALREEGQRVDGIAEFRGIDLWLLKHADLELLAPVRAADLPQSIEKAVPKILLFSPEKVESGRAFILQFSDLGGVIESRFFFPFCHVSASPDFRPYRPRDLYYSTMPSVFPYLKRTLLPQAFMALSRP